METKDSFRDVDPPDKIELCVYLIREELKSWKFFNSLRALGLDDNFYQTDLCEAILKLSGLPPESDETLDFYCHLMDRHSSMANPTDEDVTHHARLVHELLLEKRKEIISLS